MRRECESASETLWRESLQKAMSPLSSLIAFGVVALIFALALTIGG
ncbi:MAG: hypothetical protein RLO50_15480 [Azospirillaceae bacterium]